MDPIITQRVPSPLETPQDLDTINRESIRKNRTSIIKDPKKFQNFNQKTYIQVQWGVGMASYHFEDNETMYINWSEIKGDKRFFDSGEALPAKLKFTSTRIDEEGYFCGVRVFGGWFFWVAYFS